MKKSVFATTLKEQELYLRRNVQEWLKYFSQKALILLKQNKNSTLVFVGTGSSYHVALWCQGLAQELGLAALSYNSWDFLTAQVTLPQKSLYFIFSHRGAQDLTAQVIKALHTKPHILVTALNSPVGNHAYMRSSTPESSKAHSKSLIGAMCAISVALGVMHPRFMHKLERYRLQTAKIFGNLKLSTRVPKLSRGHTLHIVGGGPFEAISREIALKAKEICHIPALFYNVEEFLHGPLAAVSPQDHVLFLAPQRTHAAKTLQAYLQQERAQNALNAIKTLKTQYFFPKFPTTLSLSWQALIGLFYGQKLCLIYAQQRSTDPDANHQNDPLYKKAFQHCTFTYGK